MSKRSWIGTSSMIFILASGVVNPSSMLAFPPPSPTWQVEQLTCRYDLTRASSGAPAS